MTSLFYSYSVHTPILRHYAYSRPKLEDDLAGNASPSRRYRIQTSNHVPLLVIEPDISSSTAPTPPLLPSSTQARSCPAQIYYKMDISNKGEDHDAMANRKYIHWQDEGVEKIPPNEAEDIQAVADQINVMQKAQYNSHRHCYTG